MGLVLLVFMVSFPYMKIHAQNIRQIQIDKEKEKYHALSDLNNQLTKLNAQLDAQKTQSKSKNIMVNNTPKKAPIPAPKPDFSYNLNLKPTKAGTYAINLTLGNKKQTMIVTVTDKDIVN